MKLRVSPVVGAVVSLLLAIATAGGGSNAAGSEPAGPHAGAPGAGDDYYPLLGNGGFDVRHYDIGISLRVRDHRLTGVTTVEARATQALDRFDLDLRLPTRDVRVNGMPARWQRRGRELRITPARPLHRGQPFSVRVTYRGHPGHHTTARQYGGWYDTPDGGFVAGAPEAGAFWFPCSDHPSDKATYDVRVDAPARAQVISNGERVSRGPDVAGRRLTHWRTTAPMQTYAATVAIGDFAVSRGTTPGGVPYLDAVSRHMSRRERAGAARQLRRTARVLDFYQRAFGPYPFDSTGGIAVRTRLPFALETQDRPVYPGPVLGKSYAHFLVIHELAHEWFADSVTIRRFADTWLNEGFANWAAFYWQSRHGGPTLAHRFRHFVAEFDDQQLWSDPAQPSARNDIYSLAVNIRGALTLQALRYLVGATTQLRILRTWATEHRHRHGTTRQFIALAERISHRHLGRFFRVWLRAPHSPAATAANGFPARMRHGDGRLNIR